MVYAHTGPAGSAPALLHLVRWEATGDVGVRANLALRCCTGGHAHVTTAGLKVVGRTGGWGHDLSGSRARMRASCTLRIPAWSETGWSDKHEEDQTKAECEEHSLDAFAASRLPASPPRRHRRARANLRIAVPTQTKQAVLR